MNNYVISKRYTPVTTDIEMSIKSIIPYTLRQIRHQMYSRQSFLSLLCYYSAHNIRNLMPSDRRRIHTPQVEMSCMSRVCHAGLEPHHKLATQPVLTAWCDRVSCWSIKHRCIQDHTCTSTRECHCKTNIHTRTHTLHHYFLYRQLRSTSNLIQTAAF